jgi:hypothetical protein
LIVLVESIYVLHLKGSIQAASGEEMVARKDDDGIYVQIDIFVINELNVLHDRCL